MSADKKKRGPQREGWLASSVERSQVWLISDSDSETDATLEIKHRNRLNKALANLYAHKTPAPADVICISSGDEESVSDSNISSRDQNHDVNSGDNNGNHERNNKAHRKRVKLTSSSTRPTKIIRLDPSTSFDGDLDAGGSLQQQQSILQLSPKIKTELNPLTLHQKAIFEPGPESKSVRDHTHDTVGLSHVLQESNSITKLDNENARIISTIIDAEDDSDDFEEDYDYNADQHLGGELELPSILKKKHVPGIDFVDLMNKSYHSSRNRLLTYQEDMLRQKWDQALVSGHVAKRNVVAPSDITEEEMSIIFAQVADYTSTMKKVDWNAVANEVFRFTGYQRPGFVCLQAFEEAIKQFPKIAERCTPDLLTLHSKASFTRLLNMRERGQSQRHVVKDMLLLRQLRNYGHATSFNFSSGSVVDMAFKSSTLKLAVANVATQDIYNRNGNLLLCDLNKSVTKTLWGHERPGQVENQTLTVTVNDIKLSYSKNFFLSGADDHRVMVWDAETGNQLNVIQDARSRVNRVAIMEDSLYGEDIFASCSSGGLIHIYSLSEEGKVKVGNKELESSGGRRSISSINFGYGHFWDCLAAGVEGLDQGIHGDAMHGHIAFYDANVLTRKAVAELGFRQAGVCHTTRSVSALSFSSSGQFLVCGTSGRTNAGDDEKGDGLVRVFDVMHAREIESAVSGHEDVNVVDFSPCERYIISCSHRNEIAVFDRRFMNRPPLHRLHHADTGEDDLNAGITSALWWSQGSGTSQSMLMTGGGDGAVKLWDIRRATEDAETWSFEANLGPIARLAASPLFEHLIIGGDSGTVSVYTLDHSMISHYKDHPMTLLSYDN